MLNTEVSQRASSFCSTPWHLTLETYNHNWKNLFGKRGVLTHHSSPPQGRCSPAEGMRHLSPKTYSGWVCEKISSVWTLTPGNVDEGGTASDGWSQTIFSTLEKRAGLRAAPPV